MCVDSADARGLEMTLSFPPDGRLFGSNGGRSTRYSGFLLSIVSPVLHKMVCGAFKEGLSKRVELGETEEKAFETVLGVALAWM